MICSISEKAGNYLQSAIEYFNRAGKEKGFDRITRLFYFFVFPVCLLLKLLPTVLGDRLSLLT